MPKKSDRLFAAFVVVMVLVSGGAFWWLSGDMSDSHRRWEVGCRADTLPARIDLFGVYMHQRGEYSGLVKNEDGRFEISALPCYFARFVFDAPADEPAWLEISPDSDLPCRCKSGVFHLHSPEDIRGAGWRRLEGKTHTSGSTEVIE